MSNAGDDSPGAASQRFVLRLTAAAVGLVALLLGAMAPSAAGPFPSGSASGTPPLVSPGPSVPLLAHCTAPGTIGHPADSRVVHCVPVDRTDAFVWSLSRQPMPRDPSTRPYTCDNGDCRMPDGTEAPDYLRCGLLCDEPPTSGDVQSGLNDCLLSGTTFDECESRLYARPLGLDTRLY